jgi:hypothetical protein
MERLIVAVALLAFFVGLPVALGVLDNDTLFSLELVAIPVAGIGLIIWTVWGLVRD